MAGITDERLSKSIADLINRLRAAGDMHPDLCCLIYRKLPLGMGDCSAAYGEAIRWGFFNPCGKSNDFWYFAYYRKDLRKYPNARNNHGLGSRMSVEEYQVYKNELAISAKPIIEKAEALFTDALWLIKDTNFSAIPGLGKINQNKLIFNAKTWMWLVFQAAWSQPTGTILRAHQVYPVQLLVDAAYYKETEGQKLPYKEQVSLRNKLAQEVDAEAKTHFRKGQFFSQLPVNPFLASAQLLELALATPKRKRWNIDEASKTIEPILKEALANKKKITLRELEKQTTISKTTIGNTSSWDSYQKKWDLQNPKPPKFLQGGDMRANDTSGSITSSAKHTGLNELIAKEAPDTLEDLIAEQEADFEESPLS